MPATPADMPWLTNDEKTIYLRELAEDWSGDDETDMFSWSEVWSVFVDGPHVLLLCLPMFLNGVMVSSLCFPLFIIRLTWISQLFGLANL